MLPNCRTVLLSLVCLVSVARAQEQPASNLSGVLDGVAWIGPGASLQDLRGKSVVIITYVTWCPKCNNWSPDFFQQIKAAAADKPVVIVAVCTDAPTIPGPQYVSERGLVGMNILHAYDANMDAKLQVDDSQLFNVVLIGPDGNVLEKDVASRHYVLDNGQRDFTMARTVRELANPGTFTIVTDDMPAEVRTLLWPMELGRIVPGRDLNRVKRQFSLEARKSLDDAVQTFAARQLELINEWKAGEAPQQMAAFSKADMLSKAFPSTDEGRAARQVVTELNRDAQFKKEIAARNAYEQLLNRAAKQPQSRQEALLAGFAKRFEGTYFAAQAEALAAKDASERVSTAGDPVVQP
jgi:hypothetical protein